ncbi:uncharacterized protein CPUR_06965 [Claviceps purpurea 20.1]|uniref:Uncharacterized protein n=1 Tax=Claviceps purpurea (strain 20.1) TaxID=1111077 RepID=M1VXH7_CLAP2|nr:uncharacterized protein CPUR_06965 [Claviceps purpurea 20.1]
MNRTPRSSPSDGGASASALLAAATADMEAEIPVLTSMTPAIFVPIPADFLTSFIPPRTPEEHLQGSIATLDAQASAVKANILALTKREGIRVAREEEPAPLSSATTTTTTTTATKERTGISPQDRKLMVANMEAPKGAAAGAELPEVPNFDAWPTEGAEEKRENKLRLVVSGTMSELRGYENFVRATRGQLEEALRTVRLGHVPMDLDEDGGDGWGGDGRRRVSDTGGRVNLKRKF